MQAVEYKLIDDLSAHLIEWVAYYIMQDFPTAAVCEPGKTPVQRFETDRWNYHASRVPYDYFHLLEKVKVIQVINGVDLRTHQANCRFFDIIKTAKANIHEYENDEGIDNNTHIFRMFLRLAHKAGLIPHSEDEYFHIESYWERMFDYLISQKLVRKTGDRFFWQKSARPILEENGAWSIVVSNDLSSPHENLMNKLDAPTRDKLYKLASSNQNILAVKLLMDATDEDLGLCKGFLENFMFPSIWGAEPSAFTVRTWHWLG